MTVKLLLLKSGEDIIADVKELSVGEKTVGYLLNTPYVVKIESGHITDETSKSISKQVEVTFYPYIPLSEQREIPIPSDWVVTIVEPVNQVEDMYNQRITEKNKNGKPTKTSQNIGTTEQSNSDNAD